MRLRLGYFLLLSSAVLLFAGCQLRGKPSPGPEVPRPDSIQDFAVLYGQNCAGCHGAGGKNGAAMNLSDPLYLAIVDDDTLRATISKGRPGTAMSAFAQKEGGMLTAEQINSIILGMRRNWGKPDALAGTLAPSYAAKAAGNPQAGQAAYATFCASCHGADDKGGPKAGSVINPSYLSLISDQGLRTIVITGRHDFNAPDWRNNIPGRPMTEQEISDVVAWMVAQRPTKTGVVAAANAAAHGGVH